MKRVRFYVGTSFDSMGGRLSQSQVAQALNLIERKLTQWAGGCSQVAGTGSWHGPDGIVQDQLIIFETLKESDPERDYSVEPEARKVVALIKDLLDQEAVLVTIEEVRGGIW